MTARAWLPLAAYAALVFSLSSLPQLAPGGHVANSDKLAHLVEYAVFGFLLGRALTPEPGTFGGARTAAGIAIALLVAGLDELAQGPAGRTTSAADWMTDGLGAAIALSVRWWRTR